MVPGPALDDEPPDFEGGHTGLAEVMMAVPVCAATKYAPVTPNCMERRPFGRGESTPDVARMGAHWRVEVPRSTTRTPVPGLTQKALPLSLALTMTVRRAVGLAWHEPGAPTLTGGAPAPPAPGPPHPPRCFPPPPVTAPGPMMNGARGDFRHAAAPPELRHGTRRAPWGPP